jgi:hypothetical protein
VASLLVALVALAGSTWVAPPVAAEATGGCRPVGGTATATGGPNRATVVVDPGSGPVWSACVSFSGTISGLDAMELAAATIPGLDPVYEPYPGQGRAVCRLLGVGNDPPNCLSKTVAYWSYFRDGAYSRGGGGASQVGDGDIEGWSFSSGTAPRAATHGTEAVPSSAVPTTAPPTTAPPGPAPTEPSPVGPAPGATVPDPGPGGSSPGSATTGTTATDPGAPGSGGGGPSSTTLASAPGSGTDAGGHPTPPDGSGSEAGSGDETAAAPVGGTVTVTRAADSGSSLGSVLGFGSALGALGVAAVVVRRRRDGHGTGHPLPVLEDG